MRLAERISGASAADIARIHLDPQAWRAAALVGTSLLKASITQQEVYPQAVFPFEGNTDLQAAGQWLSFGDQPRTSFFGLQLALLLTPLPFSVAAVRGSTSASVTRSQNRGKRQSITSSGWQESIPHRT